MGKLVKQTRIYLDCYDLLNRIIDFTVTFPKDYKHTIGKRMIDTALNLVEDYVAAYTSRDQSVKVKCIDNFVADFEVLKMLVRLSGERCWLSGRTKHAILIELMDTIGKQLSGYRNSLH